MDKNAIIILDNVKIVHTIPVQMIYQNLHVKQN